MPFFGRRPRLATLAVLVLVALLLTGCGGGSSRPPTFGELSTWLTDAGGCDGVEARLDRLPVPPSRREEVSPAVLRFNAQATLGGLVGCGGANGYISYFRRAAPRIDTATPSI